MNCCIVHQRPSTTISIFAVIAIRFSEKVGGNQNLTARPPLIPPLPFPLPFPPPLPLLFPPFASTRTTVMVVVRGAAVTVVVTTIVVVTVTTCAAASMALDWWAKFQFGFSRAPATEKQRRHRDVVYFTYPKLKSANKVVAESNLTMVFPVFELFSIKERVM